MSAMCHNRIHAVPRVACSRDPLVGAQQEQSEISYRWSSGTAQIGLPPVGIPRLDGESSPQHKIMIHALAVIMPRNDIALFKRKETYLNVDADHDWLDIFHLVVRHDLGPFR